MPWPENARPAPRRKLCVCESCSLIFRPKRKSRARYCPLCAKRPAAPVLGAVLPSGATPGEPMRPGRSVQVRVPKWNGAARAGLGVTTIGISTEAKPKRGADGQLDYDDKDIFIGYRTKKGSAADRKKRARRACSD